MHERVAQWDQAACDAPCVDDASSDAATFVHRDEFGHEERYAVLINGQPAPRATLAALCEDGQPPKRADAQDSYSCASELHEVGQAAAAGQCDDALDVLTSYGEPIDGESRAAVVAVKAHAMAFVESMLRCPAGLLRLATREIGAAVRHGQAAQRFAETPTDHDAATLPRKPR